MIDFTAVPIHEEVAEATPLSGRFSEVVAAAPWRRSVYLLENEVWRVTWDQVGAVVRQVPDVHR